MAVRRLSDRSGNAAQWTLIAIAVAAAIGTIALLGVVVLHDPPREGFRLRAQTMIPIAVNEVGATACPGSPGAAPLEYSTENALAARLSVYEGEIVAVRVILSPFGGPVPRNVRFSANWPEFAVASTGPTCVFVLADDVGTSPDVNWEMTGDGEATFTLVEPRRYGDTVLEIWLEANNPADGGTMFTALTIDEVSDDYVVDQLSGRVSIERRAGSVPGLTMIAGSTDETGDDLSFTALIQNAAAQDRSFDVRVVFESPLPGVSIQPGSLPDGVQCIGAMPVVCSLGTLDDTSPVEIGLVAEVDDGTPPQAIRCGSRTPEVGVCLSATVTVDEGGVDESSTTELFLPRRVAASGELDIETDQEAIARRPGEEVTVFFAVGSLPDSDVSNLAVTGSDCSTITRVAGEIDDGDAFLEPGERWSYECVIGSNAPESFRLLVAGLDDDGERVTGSFDTVIQVVDPALAVEVGAPNADGRTSIVVTNVGQGSILDVAVRMPGCEERWADLATPLAEQQSFTVVCFRGDVLGEEVVAYGTDIAGRPFVSRGAS